MKVRMLFVQYKEAYPGEYGPAVLASVDEFTDSDNPAYFTEECKKQLASVEGGIESHAVITVDVSDDAIERILRPAGTVAGRVVE